MGYHFKKQLPFGEATDKKMTDVKHNSMNHEEVSDSFNHAAMGRPLTGYGKSATADAPKYKMFSGEDVGEHFGRSGSPKGNSPRV